MEPGDSLKKDYGKTSYHLVPVEAYNIIDDYDIVDDIEDWYIHAIFVLHKHA
jgi:hypothetical protein